MTPNISAIARRYCHAEKLDLLCVECPSEIALSSRVRLRFQNRACRLQRNEARDGNKPDPRQNRGS